MPKPSTPERSTIRNHPPRHTYNPNGGPSPMTMQNYTNLLNATRRARMGIAGAAPPAKKVPGAPTKQGSNYGQVVELNNVGVPGREANTTNISTIAGESGQLPPSSTARRLNFNRVGGAYIRRRKHTTRRRKQSRRHRRH